MFRDLEIEGRANEIRNLTRGLPYRAEYRAKIRRAVGPQPQRRRMRQCPMGGINNDPAGSERNVMFSGDFGRDVRFHIDGGRAGLVMQPELFVRARDNGVGPHNVRMNRIWQDMEKPSRPCAIGGDQFFAVPHTGRHDPIACNEIRCQPASNTKTDDACRATRDRCAKSRA